MSFLIRTSLKSQLKSSLGLLALVWSVFAIASPHPAKAEAMLVVDVDTGKVLHAENATYPWYPASVTKLMTAYVILKAVKEGRLSLDTMVTVSPTAASQVPSKMGFAAGTRLTVDNTMKMMMVKSANDMAVVLAEGLDGSIDAFADEMNRNAQRLGMTQTHYVNPNGLPAEGHVTSARDLAILARAIIRDLPEYEYFVHIPAIKFGRRITRNFNSLIGRYPGADGMKTGFICASGFNLVATATRSNKRLIAVVLGAPSSSMRAYQAAQLLERGFSGGGLPWLTPSLGTVDQLAPVAADPPDLHDDMCGPHRKRQQAPESDDDNAAASGEGGLSLFSGLQPGQPKIGEMLAAAPGPVEPVVVYTGPTKTGAALIAANTVDAMSQTPKAKGHRAKAAKHQTAAADAKSAAKPEVKSEAKSEAKSAAASPTEAKPAKTAAAKTASVKPAALPKTDGKPAAAKPVTTRASANSPVSGDAKPNANKPNASKPTANKPKTDAAAKPAKGNKKEGKGDGKPVTQNRTDGASHS